MDATTTPTGGRAGTDAQPWRGAELFTRPDWDVGLGAKARAELADALAALRGRDPETTTAGDAPTPALDSRLARVRVDLEDRSGVARLRGMPDGLDDEDLARALWLVGSRIGTPLSQGADGRRLLSVRDRGYAPEDPRFRGPHSSRPLRFHTDRCDVIGFACARPAEQGGDNHLLHARALRDELRRRHPEHAATLERDALPYLRHTVDGGNTRPFSLVPVFTEHRARFAASLLRVLVDRAEASPDAPSPSPAQHAALDALEEVAEDPRLYATLRLAPGDLLFLNNWLVFHRRTAFQDSAVPVRGRLLYRIWLASPASRELDPRFAEHFGATAAGALRGGMRPARRP